MIDTPSQQTRPMLHVRVSTAIPRGMVIWTNGECIVGVHWIGAAVPPLPDHVTMVHFSAEDFPGGSSQVAAFAGARHD